MFVISTAEMLLPCVDEFFTVCLYQRFDLIQLIAGILMVSRKPDRWFKSKLRLSVA